jgi:general secretion pathway protein L
MISRIFTLWIEGLVAACTVLRAWLRPRARFQLRVNSGPLVLSSVGRSEAEPLFVFNGSQPDRVPEKVLQQTRGGVIEIVIPKDAILQHKLDGLPAESFPYVGQVVLHQLETHFPWRANDVLHSTRVEKRTGGSLDVTVWATARSAIEPALAAAQACGASEIRVVGDDDNDDNAPAATIVASVGSENQARLDRAQKVVRYAVVALLVVAAGVVGWTVFASWSLSSDVAALDLEIAERRAILKRIAESAGGGQSHGLEAKKNLAPVAVVVLDELSVLLPDTTYLTDLSLDAGHLRITGVSANAAELVPLLEGSGHFKNAVFYAPTTRLPGGAIDRFSIEATVVTQTPVTR